MKIQEIAAQCPVIPVLSIADADDAVPLARALVTGGLRVLEITLRTSAALEAIRRIARDVDGAITGVGTVTVPEEFTLAADAGAVFAVSPGFTAELADAASLPWLPGIATASEAMQARRAGYSMLKLFPAETSGGTAALKALAGPFPDLRFCPTGGIGPKNAADYLRLDNVICVGGSWPAPADAVKKRDWARIEVLAREAAALAG
jgi:2-dehydro-3-deoxyphosphogluconate aldolase/(4S)-4-hydroxy-2-oxoglutarate aldolase